MVHLLEAMSVTEDLIRIYEKTLNDPKWWNF